MHPDGEANSGRFFLREDVDTRVDLEWTVAVRILGQAHFLQTFARNVNPAEGLTCVTSRKRNGVTGLTLRNTCLTRCSNQNP